MTDVLDVIEPGPLSTIQDGGRFGYQRFGISASGAVDQVAFRLANALVGNGTDAAVVEMTLAGVTLRVGGSPALLAYVGAEAAVAVDGRPVADGASFKVEPGAVVTIGPMQRGLRGYLAVAGGIACEPVQGSRSTHTRSAIGGLDGGSLQKGDAIPITPLVVERPALKLPDRDILSTSGPVRVLLGPQDDLFSSAGIETFLGSGYRLSSKVDRMGCQLEGPPIQHRDDFNIVSDGIVNGSIQVPGNGQPIILLADRQTTGGYAKIATVLGPDLRKIAQARPGDILHFAAVDAEEAERIATIEAERLSACMASIRPRSGQAALDPHKLWTIDLLGGIEPPIDSDG